MATKETPSVEVFNINGVARLIGQPHKSHILEMWIKNPEISTPPATLKVNGQSMWDKAGVDAWKVLWDKQTKRERELEEERLNSETVKKSSLIEFLIEEAKLLASKNSRCYTHNRGNSMSDGRRRVVEFEGKYDFVNSLLGNARIPADKRTEIHELLNKAKDHVNMQ